MSKVYSAAVIGVGMGGKASLRALLESSRFEPVAIADPSEQAQQQALTLAPEIQVFSRHGELFAACQPDVICIATWPPSHLEVTRDAVAQSPRGILLEKPLADTWADGRAALAAIREREIPVVVPHGLLVARHVREILDRVRQGEIGDLELIEIQCTGWDIINAGIHWLNLAVTVLGDDPVQWVMAACDTSSRTFRDGMQVETLAVTYMQTRSGVRVVMNTGDYVQVAEPGKGVLYRLVGSRGKIDFWAWEPRYRLVNDRYGRGQVFDVNPGPASGHQLHLEALAEQMDRGKTDYALAQSSLAALELCEAAYVAARERCTVWLPLERFGPPERTDWDPGRPYLGHGGGRDGRRLPPAK